MPRSGVGFGMDSFGAAPFGVARWSHRILWENIPDYDKALDSTGDLFKFMQVMGDGLNQPRREIRKFLTLRDARTLRTKWNEALTFSVSLAFINQEDSEDGRAYVIAVVSDGSELAPVGPEWSVDDGGSTYSIRSVDKINDTFEFYASALPSVSSVTLRPPTLLGHLGADYDISVDGAEPEVNQRSSVYDLHKLLDLKGTARGIELRAKMAGFEATIFSLYRVAYDVSAIVGADRFFEIPDGSGEYYTDVAPSTLLYDAVPADLFPTDTIGDCSVTGIAGTITGSTGAAGEWATTFSTSVTHATSEYWYFTYDSDTSEDPTRYYVNPDVTVGPGEVGIGSTTQPVAGDVTWRFYCPIDTSNCDWCKSYKLRIELEIVDAGLLSSPRALESAFQRMKAKIEKMLPAHVKVVQYVFSSSHTATLIELATQSVSQTLQFALFDVDAADIHPTDQFTITFH